MNKLDRIGRHRGVSLIELTVIMSAASVILSLSAGLIHRIMHAETAARSMAAIERNSLRLAASLRRDVNVATRAITDVGQLADGTLLQLTEASGASIEYRRDGQTIHRLEFVGDHIVAREQFTFAADFDTKVTAEGPRLVLITITSRNQLTSDKPHDPVEQAKSLAVDIQVVAALQGGGQ